MNREKLSLRILVRGSNDVASAVAHCLFSARYGVVIHDDPKPTVTRRKMAFADAIFDGETTLMGVTARRVEGVNLRGELIFQTFIPISESNSTAASEKAELINRIPRLSACSFNPSHCDLVNSIRFQYSYRVSS